VVQIAHQLLGAEMMTTIGGQITSGMVVETEAYRGPEDKAICTLAPVDSASVEILGAARQNNRDRRNKIKARNLLDSSIIQNM